MNARTTTALQPTRARQAHRKHPSEMTSKYVELGIQSLSTSLTSRYGRAATISADVTADVSVMARYNALRGFDYVARSGGVVLATWSLAVNYKGYKAIWPTKVPAPTVLRGCDWVVVVRQDHELEPAYRHLLRLRWSEHAAAHADARTGVVQGFARYGKPAVVRSGNRTYDLHLAQAKVHHTRPGDLVQFVPQMHQGRAVAHIVAVVQRAG